MNIRKNFFSIKEIVLHNYQETLNRIISLISIGLIIVQIIEIGKSPLIERNAVKTVLQIILAIIGIITVHVCGTISNKKILKLRESNKNLLEVNDKIRCFKHDFNNIMQAIDGYIVLHDIDSLQIYFDSLLKECNYVNVVESLNTRVRENPAILSVLLNKFRQAEKNNINMNIEILFDLSEITTKSYMISRILGILLDNALEASLETEEKLINVQFLREKDRNRMLIRIENTYLNKNIDIKKIFEKEYSTKTGNTGLGLWKINDILSQDENIDLYTTKDDNMFKQQIEIYE